MDPRVGIEETLDKALTCAGGRGAPARLAEAMRYAVMPGGARVRPRLCLAVALASGERDLRLAYAAGCAIELLHCASLVHDDLPCFDDADLRRGKPSVHRAYGEDIAVLTGDALIVLAFQMMVAEGAHAPERLVPLMKIVADSVGAPNGIVAGQAWESEPDVALIHYERAKTGSLFAAATAVGAAATGADPARWSLVGARIGEAFQVADDILDLIGDADKLGKPVGQDSTHGRPSVALEFGLEGARQRLEDLVDSAVAAVPECHGGDAFREQLGREARSFVPAEVWHHAA